MSCASMVQPSLWGPVAAGTQVVQPSLWGDAPWVRTRTAPPPAAEWAPALHVALQHWQLPAMTDALLAAVAGRAHAIAPSWPGDLLDGDWPTPRGRVVARHLARLQQLTGAEYAQAAAWLPHSYVLRALRLGPLTPPPGGAAVVAALQRARLVRITGSGVQLTLRGALVLRALEAFAHEVGVPL